MADAATNIAALEVALASGELRVEVNGEMVIFRSVDQIKSAIAYFQAKIDGAGVSSPAPNVTLATFSR